MKRIVLVLVLSLAFANCTKTADKESGGSATGLGSASTSEPVKENAVRVLRATLAALEAKDYDKAATFFKIRAGVSSEDVKSQLSRVLEQQELSKTGIDILAKDGKWGKLDEAFDVERANRFAERAGVPLDSCYGLSFRNAEAGFFWDGKQFKIIRCDDIGKLG